MDEEMQAVDMENNRDGDDGDPAAGGVVAAAQPDRHGFWA